MKKIIIGMLFLSQLIFASSKTITAKAQSVGICNGGTYLICIDQDGNCVKANMILVKVKTKRGYIIPGDKVIITMEDWSANTAIVVDEQEE